MIEENISKNEKGWGNLPKFNKIFLKFTNFSILNSAHYFYKFRWVTSEEVREIIRNKKYITALKSIMIE